MAELAPPPPRSAEQFTRGQTLVDLGRLAELRAAADAQPEQLGPQWRAGSAHLRASLHGHLEQREHAERYLERAWELDPGGEQVPAARVLARFLNMRSSVLDLSKLGLQQRLYSSQLESEGEDESERARFQLECFSAAADAMQRYAQGQELAALRELDALERRMLEWMRAAPDDIDTHTMFANFELTFAGVIPVGVERRLRRGIDHLELQQDHWEQLSPRARNTAFAPNVRSVFALFLAEALLAHGDTEAARGRYEQLAGFTDEPQTRVREQLLELAAHRLAHLDAYAGDHALLPPWPAGVSGCVACHSREATLPTDDLYLLAGFELEGAP